jgi:serine protease Do
MERLLGRTARPGICSYTPAVTVRRLLFAGAFGLVAVAAAPLQAKPPAAKPPAASNVKPPAAENPNPAQVTDAARAASQAAAAVQDASDQAAADSLPPDSVPKNPDSPIDRARDGIVLLERAGKVIGLGSVLSGDGRILTALSPLGHGNNLDARFADGSVSQVKMGHTDRAWDLALLIPQNARWKKGLKASRASATKAGSQLRTFSMIGAKDVAPARTIVKGKTTLVGGDSELLQDALDLTSRFKQTDIGSPILDDNGDVVGMVARACAPVPNQPCTQVPYGVPVGAVKAFLRTVPANAVPPAPWLGIQGVADDVGPVRGVRVIKLHPKSPAAAAGLRGGADKSAADVVVAVDGTPVMTPESLAETINQRAVGDSVQLLLFGGGKFRQVSLGLRAAPDSLSPKAKLAPARQAPAAGAPLPKRPPRPAPRPLDPGY